MEKPFLAEIMRVLSFFLSFEIISWDHIQRRQCPLRQYFWKFVLCNIRDQSRFFFLIWHMSWRRMIYFATKPCARNIFVSFFFPCIWRIIDMKRISRLYLYINKLIRVITRCENYIYIYAMTKSKTSIFSPSKLRYLQTNVKEYIFRNIFFLLNFYITQFFNRFSCYTHVRPKRNFIIRLS